MGLTLLLRLPPEHHSRPFAPAFDGPGSRRAQLSVDQASGPPPRLRRVRLGIGSSSADIQAERLLSLSGLAASAYTLNPSGATLVPGHGSPRGAGDLHPAAAPRPSRRAPRPTTPHLMRSRATIPQHPNRTTVEPSPGSGPRRRSSTLCWNQPSSSACSSGPLTIEGLGSLPPRFTGWRRRRGRPRKPDAGSAHHLGVAARQRGNIGVGYAIVEAVKLPITALAAEPADRRLSMSN